MPATFKISTDGGLTFAAVGTSVICKIGDHIRCQYQQMVPDPEATTWAWQVVSVPQSPSGVPSSVSTAIFTGSPIFNFSTPIDVDGAYLVRLTTDEGLPTESTRYLRVRAITTFGGLALSAAGERYDDTGHIPFDSVLAGWANDQNQVINRLNALIRRTSTSGRALYVDANRGRNTANTPDSSSNIIHMPGWNETPSGAGSSTGINIAAAHHGDFTSIQKAIDWAANQTPVPSENDPWVIFIQPGRYVENLTFRPHIHLVGLGTPPSQFPWGRVLGSPPPYDTFKFNTSTTIIETASGSSPGHMYPYLSQTDALSIYNLTFINILTTPSPILNAAGLSLKMKDCFFLQYAPTAGGCLRSNTTASQILSYLDLSNCTFGDLSSGNTIVLNIASSNSGALGVMRGCQVIRDPAGDGLVINQSLNQNSEFSLESCRIMGRFHSAAAQTKAESCVFHRVTLDTFGVDSSYSVRADFRGCSFENTLTLDASHITGSPSNRVEVRVGSSYGLTAINKIGDPSRIVVEAETDAHSIAYDNHSSGLTASNVQSALDELVAPVAYQLVNTNFALIGNTVGLVGVTNPTPPSTSLILPDLVATPGTKGHLITIKDERGDVGSLNRPIYIGVAGGRNIILPDGSSVLSLEIRLNWGWVTLYQGANGNYRVIDGHWLTHQGYYALSVPGTSTVQIPFGANVVALVTGPSGGFGVTLPSGVSPGRRILIYDDGANFSVHPCTVHAAGAAVIDNGAPFTLTQAHQAVEFVQLATGNWLSLYKTVGGF